MLQLIEATHHALEEAITVCKPGNHLGDISYAIQRVVEKAGFKVIRGLTGHGVGFSLHEDPLVPNQGEKGKGIRLVPGLVLAIEPMVSAGSPFTVVAEDESFKTKDGSMSAHFEHTVAVTESGVEILTQEQ